jgi:hypothetical protein
LGNEQRAFDRAFAARHDPRPRTVCSTKDSLDRGRVIRIHLHVRQAQRIAFELPHDAMNERDRAAQSPRDAARAIPVFAA